MNTNSKTYSFQTRLIVNAEMNHYLGIYATRYGFLKRKLWCLMDTHFYADHNELKREFLRKYAIPGRVYNSLKCRVEGQALSLFECQKRNLKVAEQKLLRVSR